MESKSAAAAGDSGENLSDDDLKWEDEVDDFIRSGDFDCAIETLKKNISSSSSSSQIRQMAAVKGVIEEHYSYGGALKTEQRSCRSIIRGIRAAEARELNVDEETQPPVLDFSRITLEEDEESATEDDDWERIADQGALPVLGGISSEGTSEHCVVDEPVETKRRGRGSFLYQRAQRSGLYSDGEQEQGGSDPHSTDLTNVESSLDRIEIPFKFSLEDLKATSPREGRPRPETSARVANRFISQAMGIKPSTAFGFEELRKQEEARKERILLRLRRKTEAWGGPKEDS